MNELIEKNISDMQAMMQRLMEISISNTNEMKNDLRNMGTKIDTVEKRMDTFENNAEVTTQQKNSLRRAVNRQVCALLRVNPKKHERSLEEQTTYEKYSSLFHRRCYSEVSKQGHLATPYECTTAQNFIQAVNDIEGWIPSNTVEGLKQEADRDAIARKIAREQGYLKENK